MASSSSLGSGGGLYNALSAPARICDTRPATRRGSAAGPPSATGPPTPAKRFTPGAPWGPSHRERRRARERVGRGCAQRDRRAPWGVRLPHGLPDRSEPPTASNLNYVAGEVVPNRVVVPVSSSGRVEIYSSGHHRRGGGRLGLVHGGGGSAGDNFSAETSPVRICDTRTGNPSGLSGAGAQCNGDSLTGAATLTLNVAGLANVPNGATAVVLNVTAVHPTAEHLPHGVPLGQSSRSLGPQSQTRGGRAKLGGGHAVVEWHG